MIHLYTTLCHRFYFYLRLLIICYIVFLLNGCIDIWYSKTDGPPLIDRPNFLLKKNYIKKESLSKIGNKPYIVNGKRYKILKSSKGFNVKCKASWYGRKFHGNHTANGEVFDMFRVSAAHRNLPLPTYLRVTNLDNGKKLIVRVNDRGPFIDGRDIDLSYAAAKLLGIHDEGLANVQLESIEVDTNSNITVE